MKMTSSSRELQTRQRTSSKDGGRTHLPISREDVGGLLRRLPTSASPVPNYRCFLDGNVPAELGCGGGGGGGWSVTWRTEDGGRRAAATDITWGVGFEGAGLL